MAVKICTDAGSINGLCLSILIFDFVPGLPIWPGELLVQINGWKHCKGKNRNDSSHHDRSNLHGNRTECPSNHQCRSCREKWNTHVPGKADWQVFWAINLFQTWRKDVSSGHRCAFCWRLPLINGSRITQHRELDSRIEQIKRKHEP